MMVESQSRGTESGTAALVQLGKVLEKARLDMGLSARQLADRVGISPAYLRMLERGRNPKTQRPSRPSAETLRRIAHTLGLDITQMLTLAGHDSFAVRPLDSAHDVAHHVKQIQEAAKQLGKRSDFMLQRSLEQVAKLSAEFRLLAEGTLRCSAEEEPLLTRLALESCESQVQAVSYQDSTWWASDVGDQYLALQRSLVERQSVRVTRIFLVEEHAVPDLEPVLRKHVDLGLHAYVLHPLDVPDLYRRDFVVYDQKLLRAAAPTDPSNARKIAEFTDDGGRVLQALEDFNLLLRIAHSKLASADRILNCSGELS